MLSLVPSDSESGYDEKGGQCNFRNFRGVMCDYQKFKESL